MAASDGVAHALLILALLGQAGSTAPEPAAQLPDPGQARMVESLETYHIAYPARVRRDGGHISHDVRRAYDVPGGRRRRRGLRRDVGAHYRLQLSAGREVMLDMRPSRLLAPGFVVERLRAPGRPGAVRRPRRHCLLHGRLRGDGGSLVALSACRGLSGYIHTGKHQYIVEPVKGHRGGRDRPRPHLVYRRDVAAPAATGTTSSACSVDGSRSPRRAQRRVEQHRSGATGSRRGSRRRSRSRSRRRRSVSAERNVETLIVADREVVQFYADDDIETYLLTVMNGVAQLYHDASIGNAINVILVRMMILESDDNTLRFNISEDGDSSLKSFCGWQITMNPSSESHPHHHDVAVLLTRRNICGENETCNTLGLAEVAGMCQPSRSCNINQDTGLSVSYTIAHELGHNFGMNHDGPGNGCDQPEGLRQHVMAPNLVNDVTPVVWSKCSRREITKFLDRDWGHCLDDQPTDHEYRYPQVPPGAVYDADHQCKLLYGPAASHCDMGNVCETLWCSVQGRCVTKLEPAAEGTRCTPAAASAAGSDGLGTNASTWCSAGECVETSSRPGAVDGWWGAWGAWGPCSRTCGTGVQSSERHCDQPVPANGGKYCVGERRRYRTCSTEVCTEESATFRAQQCAKFDTVPYQGQNYTWTPVYDQALPCQLTCKPTEQHFTAVLSDTVVDGTPCQPGSDDICINGKCMGIGCDGELGSEARADRCGVCHGNGSLCHTVRDTFATSYGDGYVVVARVPVGARSIKVEEEEGAEEGSHLAVTGSSDDGNFLNADWFVQWSGEYRAGGSVLYYFRDDYNETIFIPGPLKEPLVLKVLLQKSGTRVRYEYTAPGHEGAKSAQVFSWRYQEWSECSVRCGGGLQTSSAVCVEDEAGRVEDIYCSGDRPETKSRPCNTENCPPRWWAGPWQPCPVLCGQPARRSRSVVCVRSSGADEVLALSDAECDERARPPLDEPCELPPADCVAEWRAAPWNGSCGDDPCQLRTRRVWCPHKSRCRPSRRPASEQACDALRCRPGRRPRRRRPHAAARDRASGLTLLEVPAAGDRPSMHVGPDAARLVTRLQRLARGSSAALRPRGGGYGWRLGRWRECSSLCGEGLKERSVLCAELSTGKSVELSRCPLPVPDMFATCTQPCLQWRVEPWSPCSAMCGPGRITRQVSCAEPGRCDLRRRPADSRPCWERPCAQWRIGDWKPCSRTCDGGFAVRTVRCVSLETGRPTAGCGDPRPDTKRSCGQTVCPARPDDGELVGCKDVLAAKLCESMLDLCSNVHFKTKCCATCAEHA